MQVLNCRVLVGVCEVLSNVFHHEFVGAGLHVGVHEGCEVEVRFSVKIEFIFKELFNDGAFSAVIGDREFGDRSGGLVL